MKQACDMGTNWPKVQSSFKLLHPRLQTTPVQAAGHSLMELTEPHHQQKEEALCLIFQLAVPWNSRPVTIDHIPWSPKATP